MSLHEYIVSGRLGKEDVPFYALIMAAIRKADPTNEYKLRTMFPDVWDEFYARDHAPGGYLQGE